MSVLFDTNVVLDVLLERQPYALASAQAMALVERGQLRGLLCATTVTTLFNLCERAVGAQQARRQIRALLTLFDIAAVSRLVLDQALLSSFAGYENAVLHEAARHSGCQSIITRNTRDFANASLPVYTLAEFLAAHTA